MVSGSMEVKQSNQSSNNTCDCASQLNMCSIIALGTVEMVSGGLINYKLHSYSLETSFSKVTSVHRFTASLNLNDLLCSFQGF